MRISALGREKIKKHEGRRTKAYQDSGGVWTIGYGITKGVTPGMVISEEEVDSSFLRSLAEYERPVQKHGSDLNQNQFDALTSFSWNAGPGAASKALKIRKRSGDQAMFNYMNTKIKDRKGNKLRGLIKRRAEEIALFNSTETNTNLESIQRNKIAITSFKSIPKENLEPQESAVKSKERVEEAVTTIKPQIIKKAPKAPQVEVPQVAYNIPKYESKLRKTQELKIIVENFK